jgi:hypothetical protein
LTNEASFTITGTVKYDPKGIGLKVETLDNRGYKTTHEILCFKGEAEGLKAGDAVTVTGELGNKKSEYEREYNGKKYPVYIAQVVARKVVKLDAPTPPSEDDVTF